MTVLKGSVCAPITSRGFVPNVRKNAWIENDILQEDIISTPPSSAGWIISEKSNNGWHEWKTKSGQPISIYRNNQELNIIICSKL